MYSKVSCERLFLILWHCIYFRRHLSHCSLSVHFIKTWFLVFFFFWILRSSECDTRTTFFFLNSNFGCVLFEFILLKVNSGINFNQSIITNDYHAADKAFQNFLTSFVLFRFVKKNLSLFISKKNLFPLISLFWLQSAALEQQQRSRFKIICSIQLQVALLMTFSFESRHSYSSFSFYKNKKKQNKLIVSSRKRKKE